MSRINSHMFDFESSIALEIKALEGSLDPAQLYIFKKLMGTVNHTVRKYIDWWDHCLDELKKEQGK